MNDNNNNNNSQNPEINGAPKSEEIPEAPTEAAEVSPEVSDAPAEKTGENNGEGNGQETPAPEKPQLSKNKRFAFLNVRKFKYGIYAAIITVVVLAALVLINVALSALESNFGLRADLTSMGKFTLSDQTIEVLKTVETDMEIIVMTQNANNVDENLKELVSRYTSRNSHISFRTEDPISNPGFARQFTDSTTSTMSTGSVVVTNKDYTKFKVLSQYDFYSYNSDGYAQYFIGERVLTSAVLYVDSDVTPKVYFLAGHEEVGLANLTVLESYLEQNNYEVLELNLVLQNVELAPDDTIIVVSPRKDVSDDERETLKSFLLGGGKMFYMYDVGVDELPNFASLLQLYNVGYEDGVVVEDANAAGHFYQTPVWIVPEIQSHAITDTMIENGLYMLIPAGRAVRLPDSPKSGVTVTSLMETSSTSFNMQDLNNTALTKADTDPNGPFSFGVAIEQLNYDDDAKSTRIIAVGNSVFVSQTSVMQLSSNLDFFLSGVKWMSPQKVNVSIYGKSLMSQALNIQTSGEALVLMGIVLLALPLLVLIGGGLVWMRRKHL